MRKKLFTLSGWFFAANILILIIIMANYFWMMPNLKAMPLMTDRGIFTGWLFMILGILGQSALFAGVGLAITTLIALIIPKKWVVMMTACLIGSLSTLLLLVDSMVYHMYHYHLAGVVWQIIKAGVASQVLAMSWVEWIWMAGFALVIVAVEVCLMWLIVYWQNKNPKPIFSGGYLTLSLAISLFISYVLILSTSLVSSENTAALANAHPIIMEGQIIPYYDQTLGIFMLNEKHGLDLETADNGFFQQNAQVSKKLNYPLATIKNKALKKKYNIVFIVLDAWRFDQLNSQVTPNLYSLAKKSWWFKNNISGGDCTRSGIFSLFYSVPPTYWTAMLQQHQGPVFIHQLLNDNYEMGIFRSASLEYPAFNKTVFREVKHLRLNSPGEKAYNRDEFITNEFQQFLNKRNPSKPFFSFVFYDETHNFCDTGSSFPQMFLPEDQVCDRVLLNNHTDRLPYFNRYRNAGHFDDYLAGKVLAALKKHHLMKNTIIVVTADHGQEFNENHNDTWGHASDYTPWQTHTPLVVYWPGKKPRIIRYQTSHYDVVPTLMRHALNVTTPIKDYSVGRDLLNPKTPPFLISASYIDYAILKPNQITRIYPDGNYEINYPTSQQIPGATLNFNTLKAAYKQMNEYFSRSEATKQSQNIKQTS